MKTKKEHLKVLMNYYKEYYTDGGFPTIFSLKQSMLKLGICPRCGKISHCSSSRTGDFPCWGCGFIITLNQLGKVLWDYDDRISEKMKKSILKRTLRRVRNKK